MPFNMKHCMCATHRSIDVATDLGEKTQIQNGLRKDKCATRGIRMSKATEDEDGHKPRK